MESEVPMSPGAVSQVLESRTARGELELLVLVQVRCISNSSRHSITIFIRFSHKILGSLCYNKTGTGSPPRTISGPGPARLNLPRAGPLFLLTSSLLHPKPSFDDSPKSVYNAPTLTTSWVRSKSRARPTSLTLYGEGQFYAEIVVSCPLPRMGVTKPANEPCPCVRAHYF